jgi:hypothetical protein
MDRPSRRTANTSLTSRHGLLFLMETLSGRAVIHGEEAHYVGTGPRAGLYYSF